MWVGFHRSHFTGLNDYFKIKNTQQNNMFTAQKADRNSAKVWVDSCEVDQVRRGVCPCGYLVHGGQGGRGMGNGLSNRVLMNVNFVLHWKSCFQSGRLIYDLSRLSRSESSRLIRGFYLRVGWGRAGRAHVAPNFNLPEKISSILRKCIKHFNANATFETGKGLRVTDIVAASKTWTCSQ